MNNFSCDNYHLNEFFIRYDASQQTSKCRELMMKIDLTTLVTESRNVASENIDMLSTIDMLKVINQEDQKVALAVEVVIPEITKVVDLLQRFFKQEVG